MRYVLNQLGILFMHISPGLFMLLNANGYLSIGFSWAIFLGLEVLVVILNAAIIKEARKSTIYFGILAVASLAGIIARQIMRYPPSTPKGLGIVVLILTGVINTGMIAIIYGFAAKRTTGKRLQSEKMEKR